jgi:hypothetical protein
LQQPDPTNPLGPVVTQVIFLLDPGQSQAAALLMLETAKTLFFLRPWVGALLTASFACSAWDQNSFASDKLRAPACDTRPFGRCAKLKKMKDRNALQRIALFNF